MANLVSQASFARRMKKSRSWVCKLTKLGVISLVGGKINPIEARDQIKKFVDSKIIEKPKRKPSLRKKSSKVIPSMGEPSLIEVRRNNEILKGELLNLRLRIEKGELVPRGESINWLIALGSAAKLAFQGLPKRLAPVLKLQNDEKLIELILRQEIYSIIRALIKPLEGKDHEGLGTIEGKGPQRNLENLLGGSSSQQGILKK
jgi:hypothetical protein